MALTGNHQLSASERYLRLNTGCPGEASGDSGLRKRQNLQGLAGQGRDWGQLSQAWWAPAVSRLMTSRESGFR